MPAAKAWIKANPDSHEQPWDKKGYKMPGGTPSSPALAAILPSFPALLRKQLKGAPMPAPKAILAAAVEGAQVDFDTASRIESRYFTTLVTGQVAKNMIQAFFFDLQTINDGGSRPEGIEQDRDQQDRCAGCGHDGRRHRLRLGQGRLRRGAQGRERGGRRRRARATPRSWRPRRWSGAAPPRRSPKALLGRITPTADPADFKGVDFVIEAVFESQDLKHKVFQEIEDVVEPNAVLGLQHLHAADHRSGDRRQAPGGLHRDPLLLAGRQDAAGGNHQGREDI